MDSYLHPLKVGWKLVDETIKDISRTLAKIEIINFHLLTNQWNIVYKKK